MEKGDYNSAIDRLESSLELDSTVYETYYNLGVACIEAKEFQKAIDYLTKAISLNPKCADAYYTIAVAQESLADSYSAKHEDVEVGLNQDGEISHSEVVYNSISDADKELMIQGYLTAISNYRKYSEMSNSDKKSEEIAIHIADVEKVLSKLGYSGSTL